MKKTLLLIIFLFIVFIFTSCTYVGKNTIELFSRNFNEYSNNNILINQNNIIVNKEEHSYYYFFPTKDENEYLLSIFEDENKETYKFGICITSDSSKDIKMIEDIFNAAFYALISSKKETPSPFCEIPLNDKGEISSSINKTIEHDLFYLNILNNDAGTGIYVIRK